MSNMSNKYSIILFVVLKAHVKRGGKKTGSCIPGMSIITIIFLLHSRQTHI